MAPSYPGIYEKRMKVKFENKLLVGIWTFVALCGITVLISSLFNDINRWMLITSGIQAFCGVMIVLINTKLEWHLERTGEFYVEKEVSGDHYIKEEPTQSSKEDLTKNPLL